MIAETRDVGKFEPLTNNTSHSRGDRNSSKAKEMTAKIKALEQDVFYNYKENGIRTPEFTRLRKQYDALRTTMLDHLHELKALKERILALENC
ncbi:MAG: hypothetical protein ABR985_22345 [Methanotrichaceae archaeon]|jgi:hypothetical protein